MSTVQSAVYGVIAGTLEALEHEGKLVGNGHHLAQRLAELAEKSGRVALATPAPAQEEQAVNGHTLTCGWHRIVGRKRGDCTCKGVVCENCTGLLVDWLSVRAGRTVPGVTNGCLGNYPSPAAKLPNPAGGEAPSDGIAPPEGSINIGSDRGVSLLPAMLSRRGAARFLPRSDGGGRVPAWLNVLLCILLRRSAEKHSIPSGARFLIGQKSNIGSPSVHLLELAS